MTRRVGLALLALALVAAAVAGPRTFGKLASFAGLHGLALPFVTDPAARAATLYELGRFKEADDAFAAIGRSVTFDRGTTLAVTGNIRLAVAYFDAVLFANRTDEDAQRNRDLLAALLPPVTGEDVGRGRVKALLREHGVDAGEFDPDNPLRPIAPPAPSLRKPLDAKTVAADRAWLETLADAPGEYLRNRLAAERDRRRLAGTAAPEEASPW